MRPIALAIVNDHSTATTGRDVTAAGAISLLSTMVSGSESFASASVVGGQQDDGNNDQSTDSQTQSEMGSAESTASNQDKKATGADTTKGAEGAKAPSQSTSDGSVSVAGGIAVTIEQANSQAYIGSGRTITAGGVLTVKSAANVDGSASATGGAVTNATAFDPSAVSTTDNTIDFGSDSKLKTGDGVTYYAAQGGAAIGGLTSGTEYFVNVVSGGKVKLYDTAAHANAGGTDGLITLTSTGSSG